MRGKERTLLKRVRYLLFGHPKVHWPVKMEERTVHPCWQICTDIRDDCGGWPCKHPDKRKATEKVEETKNCPKCGKPMWKTAIGAWLCTARCYEPDPKVEIQPIELPEQSEEERKANEEFMVKELIVCPDHPTCPFKELEGCSYPGHNKTELLRIANCPLSEDEAIKYANKTSDDEKPDIPKHQPVPEPDPLKFKSLLAMPYNIRVEKGLAVYGCGIPTKIGKVIHSELSSKEGFVEVTMEINDPVVADLIKAQMVGSVSIEDGKLYIKESVAVPDFEAEAHADAEKAKGKGGQKGEGMTSEFNVDATQDPGGEEHQG